MFKTRSTLSYVIVLSAIFGLVFVIGCGSSKEKQQMSEFMQQYSKKVTEYSDVVNTADKSKKAEIEDRLDSYQSEWTNMKIEMGSEITPQALNKLDQEYQNITKKYSSLAGKS
jgi:t-SNARE complex subunit (syntaxin)